MSEETELTWTVANWITVLLMVFIGFAVVGFVARATAKVRAGRSNEAA